MKKAMKLAVVAAMALSMGAAFGADPKIKSKKEQEAFVKMQQAIQAGDATSQIAAIEDFLTKFADTEFKGYLLQNAMQLAQQKRDSPLTITYAERVLEVEPKNFEAYVTMASETANNAKEFDLDKAEKTAKVRKWAEQALEYVKDAPKPMSQIPDDAWAQQKKGASAQAHTAMAMMAHVNKKYDDAIGEYKLALEISPDAVTMFRMGETYMKASKFDDASATFDKVLAAPDASAQVKQYAQMRKADVVKLKAAAAK